MAYNSKYKGKEVEVLLDSVGNKQDQIDDLDEIRSGAVAGTTALQPNGKCDDLRVEVLPPPTITTYGGEGYESNRLSGAGRPLMQSVVDMDYAIEGLITNKADKAATLAGYGITDALPINTNILLKGTDQNSVFALGFGRKTNGWNADSGGFILKDNNNGFALQGEGNSLYFRGALNGVWGDWKNVVLQDDLANASVANAVNANKLDGKTLANFMYSRPNNFTPSEVASINTGAGYSYCNSGSGWKSNGGVMFVKNSKTGFALQGRPESLYYQGYYDDTVGEIKQLAFKSTTLSGYGITDGAEWKAEGYYNMQLNSMYDNSARIVIKNNWAECFALNYTCDTQTLDIYNYRAKKGLHIGAELDFENNIVYHAGNLSPVTTNTEQTITGVKTFSNLRVNNSTMIANLNAEMVGGLHASDLTSSVIYPRKTDGILIKSKAKFSQNRHNIVTIKGANYADYDKPYFTIVEFYSYVAGNYFNNVASSNIGHKIPEIKIFTIDDSVYIWFQHGMYQTFVVDWNCSDILGNNVESITNSAFPTEGVSRLTTTTPINVAYENSNVASATNADKLDGLHAKDFVHNTYGLDFNSTAAIRTTWMGYGAITTGWKLYSGGLISKVEDIGFALQGKTNTLYFRGCSDSRWEEDWHTVAFTDTNALTPSGGTLNINGVAKISDTLYTNNILPSNGYSDWIGSKDTAFNIYTPNIILKNTPIKIQNNSLGRWFRILDLSKSSDTSAIVSIYKGYNNNASGGTIFAVNANSYDSGNCLITVLSGNLGVIKKIRVVADWEKSYVDVYIGNINLDSYETYNISKIGGGTIVNFEPLEEAGGTVRDELDITIGFSCSRRLYAAGLNLNGTALINGDTTINGKLTVEGNNITFKNPSMYIGANDSQIYFATNYGAALVVENLAVRSSSENGTLGTAANKWQNIYTESISIGNASINSSGDTLGIYRNDHGNVIEVHSNGVNINEPVSVFSTINSSGNISAPNITTIQENVNTLMNKVQVGIKNRFVYYNLDEFLSDPTTIETILGDPVTITSSSYFDDTNRLIINSGVFNGVSKYQIECKYNREDSFDSDLTIECIESNNSGQIQLKAYHADGSVASMNGAYDVVITVYQNI